MSANVTDEQIDKLWKKVERGDRALDNDRRELGRMLAAKRQTFLEKDGRAAGFGAWCRARGYGKNIVPLYIDFSLLAVGSESFSSFLARRQPSQATGARNARAIARTAELKDLRTRVKAMGQDRAKLAALDTPEARERLEYLHKANDAHNARDRESKDAANRLRKVAEQRKVTLEALVREVEQGESVQRKEEREKRRLEREVLEAERRRIEEGMSRYRYPLTEALRQTAWHIVDVGFAELARRAHPDMGGTAEQMAALTDGRNWIRSAMQHPLIHRVLAEAPAFARRTTP